MNYSQLISIVCLLIASLAYLAIGEPRQGAENVCNITVPIKKDIVVETPIQYEIKYDSFCGILPCKKTRIETRYDQVTKSLIKHVETRACCQGYAETPEGKCAPICLNSCQNGGKCIAPNTCKCLPAPSEKSPGFMGSTCSRFTCQEENKWGSKCDKECNCPLNAYCNASNGKCLCYPGFRGSDCSLECTRDSNDPECDEINELPTISEPDANLIMDPNVMSRQKSEALLLVSTPDETLRDDHRSFGANYLVGLMACLLLITSVGLYIVRHRYNRLKNEVIYASGSTGSSNTSGDYSSTGYYTTNTITSNLSGPQDNFLSKNLSFAAATRLILQGDNGKQVENTQNHDSNTNKLIVNPLVETRLIRSHKQAEQNVYTDSSKIDFSARPLPNPEQEISIRVETSTIDGDDDESHIYQVPKSHSASEQMNHSSATIHDTSSESTLYRSFGEDSSNSEIIYEEIQSKTPAKDH